MDDTTRMDDTARMDGTTRMDDTTRAKDIAGAESIAGREAAAAAGPAVIEVAGDRAVDPDVDLHVPAQRAELSRAPVSTLAAVSAGGVLGALARYGLGSAFPHAPAEFPVTTFGINVTGCLLIGVLMALIGQGRAAHRLIRPFLGVGVLGGFTTFSAYVVDFQRAVAADAARTALGYLAATIAGALLAVYAGSTVTRRLVTPRHAVPTRPGDVGTRGGRQ